MQGNVNIPDSNITTNLTFRQLVLMNMQQLTNFPYIEQDFDALTDYELLCLVVKYLNDVIANQNEQNTSITNLYNSFLALQTYVNNTKDTLEDAFNELDDYVRNYFDNLDVQDEINNKLEDMAESGQLTDIIAQYLGLAGMMAFDTIVEMKAATNLVNGSKCHTLGYANVNDGGQAVYKIRNKTNDDIINEGSIISLLDNTLVAELVPINNKINIKQFGAKGNGVNDDTSSIQNAVDYGFNNHLNVIVPSSASFYKVTLPILLRNTRSNTPIGEYWSGRSSKLLGENNGDCRIVKIGTDAYTNLSDSFINNVNSTIICSKGTGTDLGTGIYVENLTIENYATYDGSSTFTRTENSYALYTNVARSNYKNLTVIAYYGIKAPGVFSSYFENIDMFTVQEGIDLNNGTSNTFRYLYASGVNNPYKISTYYSTLLNCCADDCTGSLFTIGGSGLSLINCGCESPKAQYIFTLPVTDSNINIDNFRMDRFIGDSNNSLTIGDCAVCYMTSNGINVNINNISIMDNQLLDTSEVNSSIFKTDTTNRVLTTTLNNIKYVKGYSGNNNAPCKIWGSNPSRSAVQSLTTPSESFKYFVGSDLSIIPIMGGINGSLLGRNEGGLTLSEDSISYTRTIWLDTKDKYHAENGTDLRYTGRHQVGDIQLFNDPINRNALGLSTVALGVESWTSKEIPLVLSGTTADRPTANLFVGLQYFDTTLNKPIWYNGTGWRDSTGTSA